MQEDRNNSKQWRSQSSQEFRVRLNKKRNFEKIVCSTFNFTSNSNWAYCKIIYFKMMIINAYWLH